MGFKVDKGVPVVSSEPAQAKPVVHRDPVPPPPPSVPTGPDGSATRVIDGGGIDPAGLAGIPTPGSGRVTRQSGAVLSAEQLATIRPFRGPDSQINYDPQLLT